MKLPLTWPARIPILAWGLLIPGAQPPCDAEVSQFQIPFPAPPRDSAEAVRTLPDRIAPVIGYLACGDELGFLNDVSREDVGIGLQPRLMAKIAWISGLPDGAGALVIPNNAVCRQTITFNAYGLKD